MKYVSGSLISAFFCLFFTPFLNAAEISCECPKLGCDPCSREHGVTFYTEKCGTDGGKVRSCARPTCNPIDVATKECPVPPQANSGPREPVVVKAIAATIEDDGPSADVSVGKVKVLHGSVSIIRADGRRSVVAKEGDLHESDTFESSKDGGALVTFNGGNRLHVHEDTAIEIKEFKDEKSEASRKALLHLIKGKVRNQVEQKYNGKTSYYRMITRAAVAGVRGTDFVMEHHEGGKLETKVETLGGKVILASLDEKEAREIVRGEGARFSVDMPNGAMSDKDMSEFIQKGTLSPVYKLDPEQIKELEYNSRVDVAKRKVKPSESAICQKPKGNFNQCVWRCVGNPAGEIKCRVDLPKVSCLRSRCNGNGEWAEETRLPDPVAPVLCPASGSVVKDCDY